MDKKEAIIKATEYSKRVINYIDIKKAFLFGSYINETNREDSDIDVALFVNNLDKETDYLTLLVKLNKIAREIDSRIETHLITESDIDLGFAEVILSTGKELEITSNHQIIN